VNSDALARSEWRLRAYPLAILITLAAAVLFATITFDEADADSRLGGDYPAFYAAGSIAAAGDWDELYSQERQQREQTGLIDDAGGYLYFSYPPFVAGGYALLAAPAYAWSSLLHTFLMAAALAGSVALLWPWLRRIGWPPPAVYVAALAFYPLLRAVPGGQNTALSLLLLAAAIRLESDGRLAWAGVALALLLYKPQFGVVIVPLLIVSRRWKVLAGWSGGAAVLYGLSALPFGWAWVGDWWEQATGFRDANATINGGKFVSLPGFVENLTSVALGPMLGYLVAAVVGAGVALYWWRNPHGSVLERYALAAAVVVVAAPQTLYYDAGLFILGIVVVVLTNRARYGALIVVAVAASWLQVGENWLGWSPLGPLVWLAAAWLVWQAGRGALGEATPV